MQKLICLLLLSAGALFSADPVGKIHQYNKTSGAAEISLVPGAAPRGKVYIEAGSKRIACTVKTSFHTKISCRTAQGLNLRRGLLVYGEPLPENADLKPAEMPPAPVANSVLLGTRWRGLDLSGKSYEFFFDAEKVLEHQSANGRSRSGIWEARGDKIHIGLNNGFAFYEGTVLDSTIEGKGYNKLGERWVWKMERMPP